jgi:hypothetical protein
MYKGEVPERCFKMLLVVCYVLLSFIFCYVSCQLFIRLFDVRLAVIGDTVASILALHCYNNLVVVEHY